MSYLKIICFIICSLGLTFHSSDLLAQHLSGKTVVDLNVSRRYEETLPGITICYPIALSMKRTAKLNDRTMRYHEEYDRLIKELDANFTRKNLKNKFDRLLFLQIKTNQELERTRGYSMLDYLDIYTINDDQIKKFLKMI